MFIDSVYSERYMGQPDLSGNFRGYQESNIIQKFKDIQHRNDTERKVILLSLKSNIMKNMFKILTIFVYVAQNKIDIFLSIFDSYT